MIYILHISDLHFVKNAASYSTEEILKREAKEKLQYVPENHKLLIVTGDFHNFNDSDYSKAEEFLRSLSKETGLSLSEDIFVIPGNHDVGNNISLESYLNKYDSKWKKHHKAYVYMIKKREYSYIEDRIAAFRPYNDFVQRLGIYDSSLGPDYPSQTHIRNWRGKLNILHLNTALIADGSSKKRQITDTDLAAYPKTWKDVDTIHIPSIAIGHNSYYDLDEKCRNELATIFFQKNVSAYLSGDRHRTVKNPEQQMIRLTSGHQQGIEIPNLVAAKSIADRKDKYSEVGFCWHLWDDDTDEVQVEFRKWTPSSLAATEPDGNPGKYDMRCTKSLNAPCRYIKPINSQNGVYFLPYGCIGRDTKIEDLENYFSNNYGPVVIRGVAGVGKTAICSYYYKKQISNNNMFSMPFISLENCLSKMDFIHSVCEALHVKEAYMDLEKISNYIFNLDKRYDALYFDNWEDFQSINVENNDFRCVYSFLNTLACNGIKILISSQEKPPSGWYEIYVDPLGPEYGEKLFTTLLNSRGKIITETLEKEYLAFKNLLELMDNHPLTMVLTSSLIEGPNDTLERIQNQWSSVCDKTESQRHRSMGIALKMSYDVVSLSPGAEELWGLISELIVDFPVYFINILNLIEPDISWDYARSVLCRRSLIQFTDNGTHLHMLMPVKAQWEHFVERNKIVKCRKLWSVLIERITIHLNTFEYRKNPKKSNVIRGFVFDCMRSFMKITEYLLDEGEYESAEKCIIAMADYYESLSDSAFAFLDKLPLNRFQTLTNGIVYKCKGDICRLSQKDKPEIADKYYSEALSCFERCDADVWRAQVMNVLGKNAFWSWHDASKALDWQKKSEILSRKISYNRGLAESKKDQAIILTEEYQNYREASTRLDFALSKFKDLGDYLGIAHCLKRQGVIMWKDDNVSSALQKYEESFEYYKCAHYIQGQADTLWRLIEGYMKCEDIKNVRNSLSKSEEIIDKIPYQMTKQVLLKTIKECKIWLNGWCNEK